MQQHEVQLKSVQYIKEMIQILGTNFENEYTNSKQYVQGILSKYIGEVTEPRINEKLLVNI